MKTPPLREPLRASAFPRLRAKLLPLILSGLATFGLVAWAVSDYASYLLGVRGCMESLKASTHTSHKEEFEKSDLAKRIFAGTLKEHPGCSADVLPISAAVLKNANDCAKTAVEIRNLYLKRNGKSPITPNVVQNISTDVISSPGRFRSSFTYHPVNLANRAEDPALKNLQPGDLLYFKNQNCQERSSLFLGHVMTVVNVEPGPGSDTTLTVIEGHTDNHLPTSRKLRLDQIVRNGLNQGFNDGQATPIDDISCCVFKGVTTLNAEPRTPSSPAGGAQAPSDSNREHSDRSRSAI